MIETVGNYTIIESVDSLVGWPLYAVVGPNGVEWFSGPDARWNARNYVHNMGA